MNEAAWNSEEFNQSQNVRTSESTNRPANYGRGTSRSSAAPKKRATPNNPNQNRTMDKLVKQNETIIELLRDIKNGLAGKTSVTPEKTAPVKKTVRPTKSFVSRPAGAPSAPTPPTTAPTTPPAPAATTEVSTTTETPATTKEPHRFEGTGSRRPKKAFVYRADGKKPNLEVREPQIKIATEANTKANSEEKVEVKTEETQKIEIKIEEVKKNEVVIESLDETTSVNVAPTVKPEVDGNSSAEATDLHAENSDGENNPFGQFGRR